MSKAYDRTDRPFAEAVLRRFRFDQNWSNRVMDCMRSASFLVPINGICQGDRFKRRKRRVTSLGFV